MNNIEENRNIYVPAELKSHFLRLYQMALTDDNFSSIEMQLLYKFAEDRGVSKNELDTILTDYTGDIHIPINIEDRISYLYDFALMIWADQIITEDERIALKKYIKKFEFKEENVEALSEYLLEKAQEGVTRESILKELKE
jgi:uncharacterized tellurite resistance protein B-like protein